MRLFIAVLRYGIAVRTCVASHAPRRVNHICFAGGSRQLIQLGARNTTTGRLQNIPQVMRVKVRYRHLKMHCVECDSQECLMIVYHRAVCVCVWYTWQPGVGFSHHFQFETRTINERTHALRIYKNLCKHQAVLDAIHIRSTMRVFQCVRPSVMTPHMHYI